MMLVGSHAFVVFHCANTGNRGLGIKSDNSLGNLKSIYHHVGIYGYRKDTLLRFTSLNQSVNEKNSNLEQLRALDNGIPIKVAMTDYPHRGIDTKEDLQYIQSTK